MNSAQLRAFHAVATAGGYTRASRALHVTQPTLSGQVKALEERYGVKLFERRGRGVETISQGRGLLAVRTLRPPVPVEVLHGEAVGRSRQPVEVRTVVAEETAKRPRVQGRVRIASGPWRLEERWWEEQPVARDYWDVELADGGLYRLYRDRASGDWFVDGIYD